jgi:hypothetical protein
LLQKPPRLPKRIEQLCIQQFIIEWTDATNPSEGQDEEAGEPETEGE